MTGPYPADEQDQTSTRVPVRPSVSRHQQEKGNEADQMGTCRKIVEHETKEVGKTWDEIDRLAQDQDASIP